MSLQDLVPFAALLAHRAGSSAAAVTVAADLSRRGAEAIGSGRDDETAHVVRVARTLGLINQAGDPAAARCAELVLVCDILAQLPSTPAVAPPEPRLVFTAPAERDLIDPSERLYLLVSDVIRMSTRELVLGGPFWNEVGFDNILRVLAPAVEQRRVKVTFYVHTPGDADGAETLSGWIAQVQGSRPPTVRWYCGPRGSLMHAKFVIADRRRGYLGTANLTSLGFDHHIEVGVELSPDQSKQLCSFLERLDASGLFASMPTNQ